MRVRGKPVFWIALSLSLLPSVAFSQPPDLTYHTVTPCIVVDTRVAGGAFAAGETRTYNVGGSGSLASQGGSTTGCGIPGFSNSIPQVQAVALNIVAFQPTGGGNVQAYAADTTTTRSVVNMNLNLNAANTTPVGVAQTSGVGDFKITVNFSGAHIIISVVGYYSKAVQTVYVHPVPGDHTASGTRLINALAGITNASATKRYVVKVEPGIYDVGTAELQMKPFVDIEGSGQEATVIRGEGGSEMATTGVVRGAASSEIRDLQVKAESSQQSTIAILLPDGANTSIRDVTISANGAQATWGIRNVSSTASKIEGATIATIATGIADGYGIGNKFEGTRPTVKRTVITVTGGTGARYGISGFNGAAAAEVRDVQIDVSGAGQCYGIHRNGLFGLNPVSMLVSGSTVKALDRGIEFIQSDGDQIKVEHSTIHSTEAGGYGIQALFATVIIDHSEITGDTTVEAGTVSIGATRLNGGPVSPVFTATCAGVYDESYTFYASTCP